MKAVKFFDHQIKTLNQTEQFNRVGYFLDMGLGKTFVGSEKMWELNTLMNLLICQHSKIDDWVEHFTDYYSEDYLIYNLAKKNQITDFLYKEEDKSKIGVINYELVFRRSYIGHMTGFTLMLDESQLIQNESAKRSKFILRMQPENVILLSGTPTAGKYEKLWSQIYLLGWNITKKAFWNSFIETEWKEDNETGFRMQVVTGYKNVDRLKRKLKEHGVIFMKTEEAFELPQQKEISIMVKSTIAYRKFMKDSYVDLDIKNCSVFHDDSDYFGKDVTPHIELVGDISLTKCLYARQLCGQYNKEKVSIFHDLVQSTEDRLIVFYNFYEELYVMQAAIQDLERPFSIVNGKEKTLHAYENCSESVTFIQYQSGAMGLNLQKANKTIYFTLPYGKGSCSIWEQSKKRTHRIGQEKTCFYYYLLCAGSVEEKNLINLKLGKDYNDELFKKEFS